MIIFFFFFQRGWLLSLSDEELDVDITMLDDEATLTMVEDIYLSASEELVPAEFV